MYQTVLSVTGLSCLHQIPQMRVKSQALKGPCVCFEVHACNTLEHGRQVGFPKPVGGCSLQAKPNRRQPKVTAMICTTLSYALHFSIRIAH